jgi:RimJ/RimL family protein N-acetyltransferase
MTTILTTPRLLIRELQPVDWPDFFAMNSSEAVMRLIGNGQIKTVEEQRAKFENIREAYAKADGLGIWAVTLLSNGVFIGAASLSVLQGTSEVQLGYRLKQAFWGQGYATELARGFLAHAFGVLGLNRLVATANLDNDVSRRVLEKAGLRFERAGKWHGWEMNYFAIESSAWQQSCSPPDLKPNT